MKNIFGKVMWFGRATVFLIGLAVILAAVMGVSSMALAAKGKTFILGKNNVATKVSTLVKKGVGPALSLKVDSGPPLAVNSDAHVANLNADKVDGKSVEEIGVNGLELVTSGSSFNSESPKRVDALCPAGKMVVGTGGAGDGAANGNAPNMDTDVAIRYIAIPSSSIVTVSAMEETPTSANWSVVGTAICATAP